MTYKEVLAITGTEKEGNLSDKVGKALQEARVTKCTSCVVSLLTKEKDARKRRAVITAELKEFRALVGKTQEKTLLCSSVRDKIQMVLLGVT